MNEIKEMLEDSNRIKKLGKNRKNMTEQEFLNYEKECEIFNKKFERNGKYDIICRKLSKQAVMFSLIVILICVIISFISTIL